MKKINLILFVCLFLIFSLDFVSASWFTGNTLKMNDGQSKYFRIGRDYEISFDNLNYNFEVVRVLRDYVKISISGEKKYVRLGREKDFSGINIRVERILSNKKYVRLKLNEVENKLKSDFFKEDKIAQSIVKGKDYVLVRENLRKDGKFDVKSFEYKLIVALIQLGYERLTWTEIGEFESTAALHKFQRVNDLTKTDYLNKSDLLLIDSLLFEREKLDKQIAKDYSPFEKFIDAPLNAPSKEHLAMLYSNFYNALPENISEQMLSVDEFRNSFISRGGNLGQMMDPNGVVELSLSEMVGVVENKEDFAFCGDAYYPQFKFCSCTSPCLLLSSLPSSDSNYMALFVHEYGHGTGLDKITIEDVSDRVDTHFGKISFDMDNKSMYGIFSETSLRGDDGEFVSEYAKTNNAEDLAETFVAYVFTGNIFRERAKSNIYLKQKYDFLKEYIFYGREYNTGDLESYNLWVSENSGIPFHPQDYLLDNKNWVWDYGYKIK